MTLHPAAPDDASGPPPHDARFQDAPVHDAPGDVPGDVPGGAEHPGVAADELAFDVHDLPGGASAVLEAVLMVADEPISAVRLATVLALPTVEVERLLADLAAEYRGGLGGSGASGGPGTSGATGAVRPRGFELREVGGGWRMYSAPAYADVVGRFVTDGQSARLTQAALETLAVIAYRQPVTRGQVSAVRGVNVDGVVRTLAARGLVAEIGTEPASGAVLYGTTGYFMERMGLGSLDDLPPLAPYLPDMDSLDGVDDAAEDHQ